MNIYWLIQICQKFTKTFFKLLETDYHSNILLNLFIERILDLNNGKHQFRDILATVDGSLPDTLQ